MFIIYLELNSKCYQRKKCVKQKLMEKEKKNTFYMRYSFSVKLKFVKISKQIGHCMYLK